MLVRMKETRAVFLGKLDSPTILACGREYELPEEFAASLVLDKVAEYRPGRLRKGSKLKEVEAPTKGKFTFNDFLHQVFQ